MTVRPQTVYSDLLAADALSLMQRYEITILAILNREGHFLGMVHLHSLLPFQVRRLHPAHDKLEGEA